jgi:hypothetical protein
VTVDRIGAPGITRAAGIGAWLADSLRGVGRLSCRSDEPRIDAESVLRLFPSGPTEAQADSFRPLMTPAEFRVLPLRLGGRR